MTSETTLHGQPIAMGCLDKRNVIAVDGRIVGELSGVYIDTNSWTVFGLELEVKKDVMDELNMKKPVLRTPKAMISIDQVKLMSSDTVQLNVPIADLAGHLTVVQSRIDYVSFREPK